MGAADPALRLLLAADDVGLRGRERERDRRLSETEQEALPEHSSEDEGLGF